MGLCLLITLPLELVLGAQVYSRLRALATAVVPVAVAFSIIDVLAIAHGLWTYNAAYVTGWTLPGRLPVEEVVFFVVVPICALLTYEAVGVVTRRADRQPLRGRRA